MTPALRFALGLAAIVAVAQPAAANPSLAPKEALDRGRTAYERGDYGSAIETIQPLIYPSIELGTEDDVVTAHRLLALSYFFVNKTKEAEQEVTSLLALRPNYQLDPIMDPPMAVRFFDDVRRHQSERLDELRQREAAETEHRRREHEREAAAARAKAERVYVDRVVEHHSRVIALVPFGWGQYQNGQTGKAIGFAVSELLLGAASAGCYIAINERYGVNVSDGKHVFVPTDATVASTLNAVQLAAGAAFWGVLAWGIIDAQVLFKREVVRDVHEHPQKPSANITPLLSPSLAGLGVQGSF